MSSDTRPVFFIHIMKTGGTTLKRQLKDSLPEQSIYPNEIDDEKPMWSYSNIRLLQDVTPERAARTRLIWGHFPYIASQMLQFPVQTMTLLRDPIDRVISNMKQIRNNKIGWLTQSNLADVENPTLEQIYTDEYLQPRFFTNHQARMFAMTPEDDPGLYIDLIEMDERRLQIACEHLQRVDCVGLLEHFDDFVAQVTARFALDYQPRPPQNVSDDPDEISPEVYEQIVRDNQLDIAFYKFAQELYASRHDKT